MPSRSIGGLRGVDTEEPVITKKVEFITRVKSDIRKFSSRWGRRLGFCMGGSAGAILGAFIYDPSLLLGPLTSVLPGIIAGTAIGTVCGTGVGWCGGRLLSSLVMEPAIAGMCDNFRKDVNLVAENIVLSDDNDHLQEVADNLGERITKLKEIAALKAKRKAMADLLKIVEVKVSHMSESDDRKQFLASALELKNELKAKKCDIKSIKKDLKADSEDNNLNDILRVKRQELRECDVKLRSLGSNIHLFINNIRPQINQANPKHSSSSSQANPKHSSSSGRSLKV